MASKIDYEKYANMSEKQLLNSLLLAKKSEAKLKADFEIKLKNKNALIRFLKAKLKEKLDLPKYDFIPLEQSQSYKSYKKGFEKMSASEKAELKAEVESEINRDYSDEL
ncbi:hypothetical protein LS70_006565 [Helicobacter sp. MIT 11-5569]|uniref:hypothetical protein n=1 Tax=Helicobacter sp. MIT 11-5569 TaxID=1548151 RepID=UPI00051FB99C|nr:hypothetical protein [Helicobacter sp. MIT 11-5569]TLD82946.1 hypothetical protein LS70_006565 [Helicobacter sp. MIT 11-5569]